MKNAKIKLAETMLDYFILEELVRTSTPTSIKYDINKVGYEYREVYGYPDTTLDIETDNAIYTIIYNTQTITLSKYIEYEFEYLDISDILEKLQKENN